MAGRKRWAKQKAEFAANLGGAGFDGLFASESQRKRGDDAARRRKACSSKNRYSSYAEALANLEWCEERGSAGLEIYQCPYCNGWHLTSHPWD